MSNFKMPSAYHPSNVEWLRPIESLTSDGVRELQRLKAENAKLRELVADMWQGMCGYFHDCRDCEHYELYEGQRFVGECEYHRRERELGIEVDDA